MASVTYSSSEDEDSSEDVANSVDENMSSHNNTSSPSNLNAVESVSEDSSYHPQDTSDVVQTDYTSFEPFDD